MVTSTVGRRHDLAEVDVEAVGEHERRAVLEVGRDVVLVHDGLRLVGDQHHDDVGLLGGLGGAEHLEAGLLGALAVGRALELADDHGDAAVAQVLGVGVALAAEADDGDGLALDQGKVGVLVVEHAVSPPLDGPWGPGCTRKVELYWLARARQREPAAPAAASVLARGVAVEPAQRPGALTGTVRPPCRSQPGA